jgi:hypothetical protein
MTTVTGPRAAAPRIARGGTASGRTAWWHGVGPHGLGVDAIWPEDAASAQLRLAPHEGLVVTAR